MEKLDLTLDIDEMIEDLKQQESEGIVMKGSCVLSFIKEHTAGRLINSVNLLVEIDSRILACESKDAVRELVSLKKWVKGEL